MSDQSYTYIPKEDQKARNAWTYYRDGGHRKAKRIADYKHQTPEQRAHENQLRQVRRANMTSEQQEQKNATQRARRSRMTPEQRRAEHGRKRALTTTTS